jgi:hypothetical protein
MPAIRRRSKERPSGPLKRAVGVAWPGCAVGLAVMCVLAGRCGSWHRPLALTVGPVAERGGMELGHKRAPVTGGAVGIGGAVARRLAAEGAQVLIADVDAEAGRATAGELGAWFVGAEPQT